MICLHDVGKEGFALIDSAETNPTTDPIDLRHKPDSKLSQSLLQRRISVQTYALRVHFAEQPVPTGWKKHTILQHTRAVIFTNNCYQFSDDKYDYLLSLDPQLGLKMSRQSNKEDAE